MTKKLTTPTLNARHEAFCRGLAEGKSQLEAYRDAGYSGSDNVVSAGAAQLIRNLKIVARVKELQAQAASHTVETVHTLVAKLEQLRRLAVKEGQVSAGVAAVMGQAKLLGLVVDKAQIEAIVRRPAPAPGVDLGVILDEEAWQQRLLTNRPSGNGHSGNGHGQG